MSDERLCEIAPIIVIHLRPLVAPFDTVGSEVASALCFPENTIVAELSKGRKFPVLSSVIAPDK